MRSAVGILCLQAEEDVNVSASSCRHIGILLGAAIGLAATGSDARAGDLGRQVETYRRAHETEIVGELAELVRIKSTAADPAGLAAAADRLLTSLKSRGFHAAELLAAGAAPPIVFGEFKTSGAKRTVVFYAHYDGQPVTPSQWSSDPFMPVMRSGFPNLRPQDIDWNSTRPPFDPQWRLYGRAAADDKASIIAFLAAFDAIRSSGKKPSVNIKVAWEGEEESGSPHLAEVLRRNQALLKSDLWLIGDAPVHQSRRQMIYFGARGIIGLQLTVYGPIKALHDGHYGNWVPNPAVMASNLIAQMRDDDGRVLIPGFYDQVRPTTPAEQAAIRNLPPVEDALKGEFVIGRSEGDEALPAALMRPALNIRGIRSGQIGEAAANAIPTEAVIAADIRLVPEQMPQGVRTAVENFLKSRGWTLVTDEPDAAMRLANRRIVRLQWEPGYPGLRSDMSSPAAKAVIAAAGRAAHEPVAVLPMMGGSVPLYVFEESFGVPVIGLPIVNHDDNQHAANENLRLQNLWDGIHLYAAMMGSLDW